jgi:membrane protease YdiL (CAAX protease family)
LIAALVAAVLAPALVAAEAPGVGPGERWALVAHAAILLGLVLALADPRVRARVARGAGRRAALGLVLAAFLVPGVGTGRFDPYATAIVAAASWASVEALDAPPGAPFGGGELAAWLLLWIPFDLRWTKALWAGPEAFAYAGAALAITALALLGRGARPELGWRPPAPRDALVGLAALVAFGAFAIPAGLATGFLRLSSRPFDPHRTAAHGLVNLLTVAVPEEVFFRGILDAGLLARWRRPWASLAVSSAAFGLMHWNNETRLSKQVAYCGFATVAGAFYGMAFRRARGLPAAVLCHALVDVIWTATLR